MNWTAAIVTFMICATALALASRIHAIARIWLEGIKTERDIVAMNHGYKPKGNSR